MAKRKRSGNRKMSIPVAMAAPVIVAGVESAKSLMEGDYHNAQYVFTGIDKAGKFAPGRFTRTYVPIVAGVLVHKFVGPSVNKALSRAKVPVLRL